jgi:ABC-2 type transport system permease protein
MNGHTIFAIARKDITDAIRNMYILFAILLPVGLSLLFGWIIPANPEGPTLTIAVYDPGQSQLIAQLTALPNVKVISATSAEDARRLVTNDILGAVIVPSGFDAAIGAKAQPELTVYINGHAGGGGLMAFRQLIETQVWGLVGQDRPARITLHDVTTPGGSAAESLVVSSGLLVMMLVMALAMAGVFVVPTLLVEEKERRTLLALQVSPASSTDIVAGKSLAGLFYAMLTALIILTMNQDWQGQWLLTLAAVILGALFVILVGLLMGGLFSTTNQVNTWSSVVMLVLLVPSWAGMLQLPAALESAFRVIPTYYLGQLVTASVGGQAAWSEIGLNLSVLAISVIVTFFIVVWRVQREQVR